MKTFQLVGGKMDEAAPCFCSEGGLALRYGGNGLGLLRSFTIQISYNNLFIHHYENLYLQYLIHFIVAAFLLLGNSAFGLP